MCVHIYQPTVIWFVFQLKDLHAWKSWNIYLLMAALVLWCCMQAFSSCGEWVTSPGVHRLLIVVASHCVSFSCGGARLQGMLASVVMAHGGLVAQIRDRTPVPCIGRNALNCSTTREVLHLLFNRAKFLSSITRKRRVPRLIYFIGSVFDVPDTKWVPAYFGRKPE